MAETVFRSLGRHLVAARDPVREDVFHVAVTLSPLTNEEGEVEYTGGGAGVKIAEIPGFRQSTRVKIGASTYRVTMQVVREPETAEEIAECERLAADYASKKGATVKKVASTPTF